MPDQINSALEDSLRSCVQEICDSTASGLFGPEFLSPWKVWKQGADGDFRPHVETHLTPLLTGLQNLPSFQVCDTLASSDPVVGPQLNTLVGTARARFRIELAQIVRSLVGGMCTDGGHVRYQENHFQEIWGSITSLLTESKIANVTIAPLPNFVAPFPVQVSENVVIDRFTDEEVTRCVNAQIITSMSHLIEIIPDEQAVGIRCTTLSDKVVGDFETVPSLGSFGRRGWSDSNSIVDDVLTALRLFKQGKVICPGEISFDDAWLTGSGYTYRFRSKSGLHFANYVMQSEEVEEFQKLWSDLAAAALEKRLFLVMALRRFNMAFDREKLADRIVDLMIAAESLFLDDGHGELKFRLAIRASTFADSTVYAPREVYKLMRTAYDIRSNIVHGKEVKKTGLPDKPSSTLTEFVLALEEIMRLSIRKALADSSVGLAGYWEDLLFAGTSESSS